MKVLRTGAAMKGGTLLIDTTNLSNRATVDFLLEQVLKSGGDLQQLQDLQAMLRHYIWENKRYTIRVNKIVKDIAYHHITSGNDTDIRYYYQIYRGALLIDAQAGNFDSYLLYLEFNRPMERKFYLPRRQILKTVVDEMQKLEDGIYTFLSISLPPRTGKSTLGLMFLTMLMGMYPEEANIATGHSGTLTETFYREILSIITGEEYLWHEIFPSCKIARQSADKYTIDINTEKRYSTLTCRSVIGTLTGAVEASKCLYADDLIEDLEEALNPRRLQSKYEAYASQLKDRIVKNAYQLMIGTRWAVGDVQGRIEEQYRGRDSHKFLVIPALNDDGESNFLYPGDIGFTKEYYEDMRDSLDDATWNAKYMGQPYNREGLLFPPDETEYYTELPPGEPDMIYAACDVAWGGGDYLAMPFAYIYGERAYIVDVIYNPGDKSVTRPIVVGKMLRHKPTWTEFEANNGGHEYSDIVDAECRARGQYFTITNSHSPPGKSKLTRVIEMSPDIKRLYFRNPRIQSTDYRAFMRDLHLFVTTGKNRNDDSADVLAMLTKMMSGPAVSVRAIQRPW